uniref:Uncharacterized protein n=1 Tax=Lepeophtheirus salmonis TaxID=72036 RepID=A0A0K2T8N1_LEPSM
MRHYVRRISFNYKYYDCPLRSDQLSIYEMLFSIPCKSKYYVLLRSFPCLLMVKKNQKTYKLNPRTNNC